MTSLSKFLRLPRREKALLLRCWLILQFVAFGLRVSSFDRVRKLLRTNDASKLRRGQFSRSEIAQFVGIAGRRSFKSNCLIEGLTAEYLLRQQGYKVLFRIGVSREAGFHAHAWVEDEGGVLIGESDAPLQALPVILPAASPLSR
jgi:hypothetical protein